LGFNFSKSLAAGAEFFLAQKVSPQSSPDYETLFKIAAVYLASD
jgi:hypothetical protein